MHPKYSNIFWHEGVKIFEERMLDTAKGQLRVQHLENDVTKALLNVFEHGSPTLLRSFLRMLQVKDAPESFALDFQVTDTEAYRRQPRRIMLTIKAGNTPTRPDAKYDVKTSRPDGCIANERTAILIEVKTQSPVIPEQIDSHVHHYLGTATDTRVLTWEDISDSFRQLIKAGKRDAMDSFLLSHFLGLLELLGIDRFNGFDRSDFTQLDMVGKIPDEDYRDSKRQFRRKLEKFTAGVFEEVRDDFSFKPFTFRVEKGDTLNPFAWSALYFHDGDASGHVNRYPNISCIFLHTGLQLSVNAEMQPTLRAVLTRITEKPEEFDRVIAKADGMYLALYFKVQFQPMDHFILRMLPGFPVPAGEVSAAHILQAVRDLEEQWPKFLHTTLHEMRTGDLQHPARRPFTEAEIDFARRRTGRVKFALRAETHYCIADIDQAGRQITRLVAKDVRRTRDLLRFLIQ